MSNRNALTEAERRLREVASFLSEHNPHQASALVSLADDLVRSAPDSANEQVALVLLGMDPYADPRPEYVALPHGPMSCSESEKLGNKLADVAGALIDEQRVSRSEWNPLSLPVADRFDDLRHALAEWRGSWPSDPAEDPPADLRVLLSDSSGDLWDARGGTLRFSREEWAVVVEGLSALRRAIGDRCDPVTGSLDPSEEVTRDMAHLLLKRISGGAGRSIS